MTLLHSHLVALVAFAALVSTVLAMLARDDARERLRFGVKVFAGLVLSVITLGWLMRPFPN